MISIPNVLVSQDVPEAYSDADWDFDQVFVDYVSLRGPADPAWPELHGGWSRESKPGFPDWLWVPCVYDTGYWIRCYDGVFEFRGNPSAVERMDNVFGLAWPEAWQRVSDLLARHGVTGDLSALNLTRLDLTMNISTGSPSNLREFFQQNRYIDLPRMHKGATDYGGLFWDGKTQKRFSMYDKALEISAKKRLDVDGVAWIRADKDLQEHRDWLVSRLIAEGSVRLEIKLKNDYLRTRGFRNPAALSRGVCSDIYRKEVSPLKKVLLENGAELSDAEFGALCKWMTGQFDRSKYAPNTYYKYRNNIRAATGYDIGAEGPISLFRGKKRVSTRTTYPFYEIPKAEDLA